eukprot:g106.t1
MEYNDYYQSYDGYEEHYDGYEEQYNESGYYEYDEQYQEDHDVPEDPPVGSPVNAVRQFARKTRGSLLEKLEKNPDNVDDLIALGLLCHKAQDFRSTAKHLAKALELGLSDDIDSEKRAEIHRILGQAQYKSYKTFTYFDRDVLNLSFEAYKVALAHPKYASDAELLMEVANVYKCFASAEGALQLLGRIVTTCMDFPRIGDVFLSTSGIWLHKGQLKEATQSLAMAVQTRPRGFQDWHMLFLQARLSEMQKNATNKKRKGTAKKKMTAQHVSLYSKSFEAFEKAKKKRKNNGSKKMSLSQWVNHPDTWGTVAQVCDIRFIFWSYHLLSHSLALAGNGFRRWWLLARVCYICGNEKDAIESCEKALAQDQKRHEIKCALHKWKGLPPPKEPEQAPKMNIKQRQEIERAEAAKKAKADAEAKAKKLEEIAAKTKALAEAGTGNSEETGDVKISSEPTPEELDLLDPRCPPESESKERARFLEQRKKKREKEKSEFIGAQKLQAIVRGRKGRRKYREKWRKKRWQCAIICQAQYRGILARRRVAQMIDDLDSKFTYFFICFFLWK